MAAPTTQIQPSGEPSDERVTDEWELRQRLAACYHVVDHYGWNDAIYNHISVRVPGPDRHFLLNPFGLNFFEVTASNLVKVDLEGRVVGERGTNYAGFLIHSAIHEAREDAHCVIRVHTRAGHAVACKQDGIARKCLSCKGKIVLATARILSTGRHPVGEA